MLMTSLARDASALGSIEVEVDGWMKEVMDGWIDGRTDGWMDEMNDGWMGG